MGKETICVIDRSDLVSMLSELYEGRFDGREVDSHGGKSPERDYRKEMIEAEYYNYNRIPGYNHHTGWVDKRYPRSRDERVTEPLDVKLIIFDE